jgi:hypothetical protein
MISGALWRVMKQGFARFPWRPSLNWRRATAVLMLAAGMLVLGYGLVRPKVSEYVGREVTSRYSEELAREVVVILAGERSDEPVAADPAGPAQQAAPTPTAAAAAPAAAESGVSGQAGGGTGVSGQAGGGTGVSGQAAGGQAVVVLQSTNVAVPRAVANEPSGINSTSVLRSIADAPAPAQSSSPGRAIEEVVRELPSGEISVTEAQLNARIASRAGSLGPIEQLDVRFVAGQVRVTIRVLGQDNVGTAGLQPVGGRIAAVNPAMTGPLSLFVSVPDLVGPVEDELNAILDTAGRDVTAVRIDEGKIVVTLQ